MIIWLASYPKSGNTWMRTFLTNYWRDADEPVDINSLGGGPIASARGIFDEMVGVEASDLTPQEIDRLRPFVYEQIAEESQETLFLKVHDAYTYTPEGVQMLSKKATKGVLYLIRNPLDVAVSFAHHSNNSVEKMIHLMADENYAFVNNPNRLGDQLVQKLFTWGGHVQSWVDEPGLNVLVLRYEDMLLKSEETFSQAVQFCELDFDLERMRKAIQFSSFDILQAQEQEHGFSENLPFSKSFFRKGKVGSWREKLTNEQASQIIADHSDVMQRFGYLNEDGEIIF